MTTTVTKTVLRAIGAAVVANTDLKSNEVFYEFEHPATVDSLNWCTINPGTNEKTKLLKDLYKNAMVVNILPVVKVTTNDSSKEPLLMSNLMDLVETQIGAALTTDYTFGGIVYKSKLLTILFEGKANPQSKVAFCHMFFECIYFTTV